MKTRVVSSDTCSSIKVPTWKKGVHETPFLPLQNDKRDQIKYLQRWLASWIAFVVIWDSCFIIYWTKHNASLLGIVEFMVPLFLLLLVSSAYAEVNAEGQRLPVVSFQL